MTVLFVIAAFLAMCFAALNSGFEVGIYSLSRVRLRYRLGLGDPRARALNGMLERPEQLISGILVAQNIAVYFVTGVVTGMLDRYGVRWAEAWSTLSLAVIFFIFVEATPKNVFRHAADVLVYPLARPHSYVMMLLKPIILLLRGVTYIVIRLGSGKGVHFDPFFTRERLAFYMREGHSEGILSKYQVELTQNILRGENVTVSRAMIPLEEVTAVPEGITWEEFRRLAADKGFSRYPVFLGDRKKIAGILNIYDCHIVENKMPDLTHAMRPAVYFAGDVHVTEALRVLRESRQPMGVVRDDGEAVGIVTVKDCVEEIVGELYEW